MLISLSLAFGGPSTDPGILLHADDVGPPRFGVNALLAPTDVGGIVSWYHRVPVFVEWPSYVERTLEHETDVVPFGPSAAASLQTWLEQHAAHDGRYTYAVVEDAGGLSLRVSGVRHRGRLEAVAAPLDVPMGLPAGVHDKALVGQAFRDATGLDLRWQASRGPAAHVWTVPSDGATMRQIATATAPAGWGWLCIRGDLVEPVLSVEPIKFLFFDPAAESFVEGTLSKSSMLSGFLIHRPGQPPPAGLGRTQLRIARSQALENDLVNRLLARPERFDTPQAMADALNGIWTPEDTRRLAEFAGGMDAQDYIWERTTEWMGLKQVVPPGMVDWRPLWGPAVPEGGFPLSQLP